MLISVLLCRVFQVRPLRVTILIPIPVSLNQAMLLGCRGMWRLKTPRMVLLLAILLKVVLLQVELLRRILSYQLRCRDNSYVIRIGSRPLLRTHCRSFSGSIWSLFTHVDGYTCCIASDHLL